MFIYIIKKLKNLNNPNYYKQKVKKLKNKYLNLYFSFKVFGCNHLCKFCVCSIKWKI